MAVPAYSHSFETCVSGKWVLAGEHAVLRGAPALALPLDRYGLTLKFLPSQSSGQLHVHPVEIEDVVLSLIADFNRMVSLNSAFELSGEVQITSTIPIGAGLGSSAALCWSIVKWLGFTFQVSEVKWLQLATLLENRFHGKSSGMDVVVVAAQSPILFSLSSEAVELSKTKLPCFTFHDTGLRMATRQAVAQVDQLRVTDSKLADALDRQMAEATHMAQRGLTLFGQGEEEKALKDLQFSMNLAQGCFERWGLIPEAVSKQEHELKNKGALSVKLTGAGGGGFLVALWAEHPL